MEIIPTRTEIYKFDAGNRPQQKLDLGKPASVIIMNVGPVGGQVVVNEIFTLDPVKQTNDGSAFFPSIYESRTQQGEQDLTPYSLKFKPNPIGVSAVAIVICKYYINA